MIAPAFPSNTARAGVLYPLVVGLAEAGGRRRTIRARRRLGGLPHVLRHGESQPVVRRCGSRRWPPIHWAPNSRAAPGVEITFGSWLVASSVPTLTAMVLLPWLLQRIMSPEVTSTPDAPAAARRALAALGPLSRDEWIVAMTFVGMVGAVGRRRASLGLDSTAVAFLGLGVLLATGVLTLGDIAKEGDVLATFIWFAVLYTLSGQLNEMGFMGYLGQRLAGALGGLARSRPILLLVLAYILLHYLFVSQTAHLLALFAVFLDVGVKLGVPAAPLAFMLLFASNFFSVIAPAGIECESALHGKRLSLPGRAVPPGRDDDRHQPGDLPGGGDALADVRGTMTLRHRGARLDLCRDRPSRESRTGHLSHAGCGIRHRPDPARHVQPGQRGRHAARGRRHRSARHRSRPAREGRLLRSVPVRHRLQSGSAVLPRPRRNTPGRRWR